jgi:hypothetical protein
MPLPVSTLPTIRFDALCVVIDLGDVLPQDPPGNVRRRGGAAASQELHEHQGLVDVAHAHALGDVLAQALVGGGGGRRHGGILAGVWQGVALVGEALLPCPRSIHRVVRLGACLR